MSYGTKEDYAMGNLLAVIHGDGGHYQGEHGTLKAIEDAEKKVVAMKVLINEHGPTKLVTNTLTTTDWFGMNCEHQINQFDVNGDRAITFCNHKDNCSACEGNCYKENCPLSLST